MDGWVLMEKKNIIKQILDTIEDRMLIITINMQVVQGVFPLNTGKK